jgi:hypothetical protein
MLFLDMHSVPLTAPRTPVPVVVGVATCWTIRHETLMHQSKAVV